MAQHTPGPWGTGGSFFGADAIMVAGSVDTCAEATVWGEMARITLHYTDYDGRQWSAPGSVEANARLIAAAPDLLKAAESLLAELWEERHSHQCRPDFERDFASEIAAIAKATSN